MNIFGKWALLFTFDFINPIKCFRVSATSGWLGTSAFSRMSSARLKSVSASLLLPWCLIRKMNETVVVNKGRNTAGPNGRGSRPSYDAFTKIIKEGRVTIRKQ